MTHRLAGTWNGEEWSHQMFSGVLADGNAVAAAGLPASLAVRVASDFHGVLRHLQEEARVHSKDHWHWNDTAGVEPVFRLYVSDNSDGEAGTLEGYECLDDLTKRAVPIAGGDRGQ